MTCRSCAGRGGRSAPPGAASELGEAASELGEAAIELVAGLALILAPVVALTATLPTWAETRYAVETAATEAGRLAARGDRTEGAAEELAVQVLANHGIDTGVAVEIHVPTASDGRPLRHGEATARVTATVPVVDVPAVGAVGGWPVSRTHHEPLDPWRGLTPDD